MAISITIKLDFDAFPKIQSSFRAQGDATQKTIGNLSKTLEQIRGGDWFGEGADAFKAEMDGEVMPAMKRLKKVLDEGDRVSKQIEKLQHDTESLITSLFSNIPSLPL